LTSDKEWEIRHIALDREYLMLMMRKINIPTKASQSARGYRILWQPKFGHALAIGTRYDSSNAPRVE
jgi:hypothetical protein